MKEIHGEVWYNCNLCTKAYKRKNDLARHQEKHHTRVLDSISLSHNTPGVSDPFNNTQGTSTISQQTQTNRTGIPRIPKAMIHVHTNTPIIRFADKSTNTEPLIILTPEEITKIGCGGHIVSFKKQFQMFVTTNNTNITAITPTNSQPTANQQIAQPTSTPALNLEEQYSTQQNIKRKGAEINNILQDSIKDKKTKTAMALSKISLKINKNAPKTKKVAAKLAKKYCPLEQEISKTPKGYNHVTSQAVEPSPSPHNQPSTSTSNSWGTNMLSNKIAEYSTITKSHSTHTNHSTYATSTYTLDNLPDIKKCKQKKGKDTGKVTKMIGTQSTPTSQTAAIPTLSIPDNNRDRWSPTELLAGGDITRVDEQSTPHTDWDRLINEEYDPNEPDITFVSSGSEDEVDTADNVDPEFRAKLNELFGPVSP